MNGLVISKNSMVGENGGDFERHDDFRKTEGFCMNFKIWWRSSRRSEFIHRMFSQEVSICDGWICVLF